MTVEMVIVIRVHLQCENKLARKPQLVYTASNLSHWQKIFSAIVLINPSDIHLLVQRTMNSFALNIIQ